MKTVTKPKIKREGKLWKCYSADRVAYGETPKVAFINWKWQYF